MPKLIRLRTALPDSWLKAQVNRLLDHRHYNQVIGAEPVDVIKPNGSPLLLLRPGMVPEICCDWARPSLRKAGTKLSNHRGFHSGLMGFYRGKKTQFTARQLWDWHCCQPFIRACNSVYRHELPPMFDFQQRLAAETPPDLVIPGTVFTTGTVNRWDAIGHDGRSPLHDDDGDLGFGVISVLSRGNYSGGYLCFPKWRIAVDLRTTDLLLFNRHDLHGNVPVDGEPGWERIATILYFQEQTD
jgi:hypothetical protein